MNEKRTVSIVGFGRFGQVLYRLLGDEFRFRIYDRTPDESFALRDGDQFVSHIPDIYQSEIVFFCVPIEYFEHVIQEHKPYFTDHHVLVDVLSVKLHAKQTFDTHCSDVPCQILLTHPMFGPHSSVNGFDDLPIMLDQYRTSAEEYDFWKRAFMKRKLKVVEMSCEEHDRLAASSQGVTHLVGRVLGEYGMQPTSIDTLGAAKLYGIVSQTCGDSWQLFENLQNYNPYTKVMRYEFGQAFEKMYAKLLPRQIDQHQRVFGIQGGYGSFNEEALRTHCEAEGIEHYQTKYLYTTEKVLSALEKGDIDFGIFAIQNSVGGLVTESAHGMAAYRFRVIKEFGIRVKHFLMIHKEAKLEDIDTLMAHPQVFKQCHETLKQKYPNLQQKSGEGDNIDTSSCGRDLQNGTLPHSVGVLGNQRIAELYDLQIVDKHLQDDDTNETTFFLVSRV